MEKTEKAASLAAPPSQRRTLLVGSPAFTLTEPGLPDMDRVETAVYDLTGRPLGEQDGNAGASGVISAFVLASAQIAQPDFTVDDLRARLTLAEFNERRDEILAFVGFPTAASAPEPTSAEG